MLAHEGITIIGLGPGAAGQLTREAVDLLRQSGRNFLRTGRHPVVPGLVEEGIVFSTFDYLYEQLPSFPQVYAGICREVLAAAAEAPVLYAVPGHPLVFEESVRLIMAKAALAGIEVRIRPALSFLDAVLTSLNLNPQTGLQVLDGLSLDEQGPATTGAVLITQVHSALVAGEAKITLLEHYPPEHLITVVQAAGAPNLERIERLPLWQLDQLDWLDHLTSVYLPPYRPAGAPAASESLSRPAGAGDRPLARRITISRPACRFPLDRLAGLLARLRRPDGCPWDREQNHLSLRSYLLEETYEVLEALQEEDPQKLCEELGDLLLQIVFHAQIASEGGAFDLEDVTRGICEKIIRRHPHVFGSVTVKDSREVNLNWERIKAEEKGSKQPERLLDGVTKHLPALLRAAKLQKKAATVGFDWPDYQGPMEKCREELAELNQALTAGAADQVEGETGDLLFSAVNLARLLQVDPEIALLGACEKFTRRFAYVEAKARENERQTNECSLNQLDLWWEEAKTLEKK